MTAGVRDDVAMSIPVSCDGGEDARLHRRFPRIAWWPIESQKVYDNLHFMRGDKVFLNPRKDGNSKSWYTPE